MADPQARRVAVLNAIVEDYVTTREPVGSRAIVERYQLGVSSATVRNDMAFLEEAGLIMQPHTSAGRIPTDAGYRSFVDSLAEIKPLSRAEKNAFEKVLRDGVDLDDVIARAVRLLAQVTHQVALVQYPSLRKMMLQHIEIVPLAMKMLLLVMITNTGHVEQRVLEIKQELTAQELATLRRICNTHLTEKQFGQLPEVFPPAAEKLPSAVREIATQISQTIMAALTAENEKIVVAGTGNLSRANVDFSSSISPVLDALEEQVILLKLLTGHGGGMQVQIGRENTESALLETSIISAGYGKNSEAPIAHLGVIGPTRMDYAAAMSAVSAISHYLTEILQES